MPPLGRRLATLRQRRGLSQVQLAKAVRVTQGYISQLEAGDGTPSLAVLKRLVKVLKVSVGELLE